MAQNIRPDDAADAGATVTRRTVLGAATVLAVATVTGCSFKRAAAVAETPGVLARVSDIPVGNAVSATLDGKPIVISQPVAGTIVAFTAICTHQGCTVAPDGLEFLCPCHGSAYDAATGQVINGPATSPLAAVAVKVVGADVMAG